MGYPLNWINEKKSANRRYCWPNNSIEQAKIYFTKAVNLYQELWFFQLQMFKWTLHSSYCKLFYSTMSEFNTDLQKKLGTVEKDSNCGASTPTAEALQYMSRSTRDTLFLPCVLRLVFCGLCTAAHYSFSYTLHYQEDNLLWV